VTADRVHAWLDWGLVNDFLRGLNIGPADYAEVVLDPWGITTKTYVRQDGPYGAVVVDDQGDAVTTTTFYPRQTW
jgi:hypothetical protein